MKNENANYDEYQKEIIRLYKDGLSSTEIGIKLNKNRRTIIHHLHKLNVDIRPNSNINEDKFRELYSQGKSFKEIAEYFKVSIFTIKGFKGRLIDRKDFIKKRYFAEEEKYLSDIQYQMILGSLLGDLSISKDVKNRSVNAKLSLVQSEKQKSLFMKKVEILGEFMGAYKLNISKIDDRTGHQYRSFRGNTKSHKVFTDIYNILYINKVKTITEEYLNLINHPIALAYWFMDDGTKTGIIATNCFSEKEVDLLILFLYEKFNIIATKQKQKNNFTIYITATSRFLFEKIISPYIVKDMEYKLKYAWSVNSENCGDTFRA